MPVKRKKRRHKSGKISKISLKSVLLTLLAVSIAVPSGFFIHINYQLPDISSFGEYAENCPKTTKVYARDGSVVGEFFIERRTLLFPDEIPEGFKKAVVAAEDADFYTHGGLSFTGILRALLRNIIEGEVKQGGSTISQQLAKNFYLSGEKTLKRKFYEALIAWKMERKLNKDEILAMYLNQIYFGHGRYGIEEASLFYFGRSAKELKLHEAALIVGLIPAPEIYSPFKNPELAIKRQRYVLSRMVASGLIKNDEAMKLASMPLLFADKRRRESLQIGEYYLDEVRRLIIRHLGWTYLYYGGLRVFSSMDYRVQKAADSALFLGLHLVDRSDLYSSDSKEKPLSAALINGIFSEGLKGFMRISGLIFTGRVVGIDRENSQITVDIGGGIIGIVPFASFSRYSATGSDPAQALKVDQVVRVSLSGNFLTENPGLQSPEPAIIPVLNLEMAPQGAIVVIENGTRRCLAISGGDDFDFRKFNRATMAFREIGSVVKPFIFAAGIDSGKISPSESFENAPLFLKGKSGIWSPDNYEGYFDYKIYGLKEALAKSINVIAVRLLKKTGIEPAIAFLVKLGVEKDSIPNNLSLALGNLALTPLHLTNMFATFGSDGKYDDPILVNRIVSFKGETLFSRNLRERAVLKKSTVSLINEMLAEVVRTGTAKDASKLGRFLTGKTGTSDQSRDLWFAGSDGKITAGVYVGYDDRLEIKGGSGAKTALPIWIMLMKLLERI